MTLKERVDAIFPDWQRWYPSLFDAAVDLGVIRARVCDPSSLLLSNRHAGVRAAAELEHRRRWSAEENEPEDEAPLQATPLSGVAAFLRTAESCR